MARILIAIAMIIQLGSPNPNALAQEGTGSSEKETGASGRRTPKPVAVRMYLLSHARADQIAPLLQRLIRNCQIVTDSRTNSIIVSGDAMQFAAFEDLLGDLDVDVGSKSQATSDVEIIPIKNRIVADIADRIVDVFERSSDHANWSVAADNSRNSLLLRGRLPFLESARAIAHQLDTPAATIQLDFAFFRADLNDTQASGAVPQDLAEVTEELKRFGRYEIVGRLATVAVEGQEFSIEGSIGDEMDVRISGDLKKAAPDGAVRLNVGAHLRLMQASSSEDGAKRGRLKTSAFEVNTTLATRRGDTIVIGTAPAGWKAGESAILVVHVRT